MNIALVDLNLLIVFDAVMREKHVTRAAKRIGMTQPAVILRKTIYLFALPMVLFQPQELCN